MTKTCLRMVGHPTHTSPYATVPVTTNAGFSWEPDTGLELMA